MVANGCGDKTTRHVAPTIPNDACMDHESACLPMFIHCFPYLLPLKIFLTIKNLKYINFLINKLKTVLLYQIFSF